MTRRATIVGAGAAVLAVSAPGAVARACDGRAVQGALVHGAPVCVPRQPRRVATLDPYYNLQMALSLGLPVVASARSGGSLPDAVLVGHADWVAEGFVDLGQFQYPDLEALLVARPDLILGDATMHASLAGVLSEIAPTVLVQAIDWRDYLAVIAEAGGAEARAAEALGAYDGRLAAVRAGVPAGTSVSFVRVVPGGFQVYVDGPAAYAPMRILAEAGLARPPFETVADDTVLRRLGWEGLLQLEGDWLIVTVGGGHHASDGRDLMAETMAHPLWQAIPAVAAGRVRVVDPGPWMGFGGLHSALAVLDDIDAMFAAR
ncbi:MAG: ABC transporter substrate-binding protein [Pseudomonadota bacterium]